MQPPAPPEALRIRLHGAAAVLGSDGRAVALERRAAALVALAALEPGISRLRVAMLLWPDSSDPRHNLRQQMLRFKRQFGQALLDGDDLLALPATVCVEPFGDGELLAGHGYEDCEEFAAWLDGQRKRRRSGEVEALRQRVVQAEAEGDLAAALAAAEQLVAADPGSEDHQRELMRIHYLRGDAAAGLAAHKRLAQQLAREHGAVPSPATERLAHALRDTAPSLRPALRSIPPTLLRPPRMIGRLAELQQLHGAWGAGQAVLVLGEAGLGKSRFLAEAARPERSASVSARPGDAAVPYATLARLLRGLLPTASPPRLPAPGGQALARLLPELRHDAALLPLPADGARLLLQEAVQALLLEARLELLVVDDLHFADDASLELLQALVGAEALEHVAWLLAQRPAEGSPAARALQEGLVESGRLRTLALRPLDVAEVAELLRSLGLPGLDAPAWAPRLHRHTGGNPLFLLETLKQMQAADVASARLPASATVGALIERRLKALSDDALALARLAAIAGPDFGPALAEAVTGRPALALASGWAELEAAQVLRERAFAHDLVLEATLRGIPKPIAEHLHAAVARHLQAHGGEAARLAAHWLDARDEAAALPWLLQAADQARDAMRRREEAEFVERAAQIATRPALPGLPSRVDLYQRAYLACEVVAGVSASLHLLDRALELASSAGERTQVLAARGGARVKLAELDGAAQDLRAALEQALIVGEDRMTIDIATDLAVSLSVQGEQAQAVALLETHWPLVERQVDPDGSWFTHRAIVLDDAGRPHEARPFHQLAMEIAGRRGEHSELVICGMNMAVGDVDTGQLERAAQVLDDCDRLRLTHDALDGINVVPWGMQAMAWRDLGRYRQSLDASERVIAMAHEQRPAWLPVYRLHRAWAWACIGQWARALQDLLSDEAYAQVPAYVGLRAMQLRYRIAQARRQPVGDSLQRAAAGLRPQTLRPMHDSIALDVAVAQGDAERAEGLRRAAQADRYFGVRWAAEWACAQLALAAGDRPQARAHAAACMARPPEHTPLDLPAGTWWHGLWQVWLGLGDADPAEAARAEGVAWIHRTLQRELAPEFHASFREAVPAHRALLAGSPPRGDQRNAG